MDNDSRSRKWLITINNPLEHGFTHERIREELSELKSLVYWCLCDEIGENETYHSHLYVAFSNAVRFSTLKNKFPIAHFDFVQGTSQQNRDYIRKEGKWAKDKKKETNHQETFEEYGEMPIERQGARNDLADLYDQIKSGKTNAEIIQSNPEFLFNIDKIERARQTIREDKYKNTFRDLEVTYIFGLTGTGKTRSVMEQYGYENVFRITDYDHPFDSYKGQDVIIFEEFRSSLKIHDMLNYLDGYPLELPCRYANKIACYTKVYIITNIDLEEQYTSVQHDRNKTWQAFLRRIKTVKIYSKEFSEPQVFDLKDLLYQPIWRIFPEKSQEYNNLKVPFPIRSLNERNV